MKLILFDIDGTLLDCGRQTRSLFAGALEAAFGTAGPFDGYDFAGKTDHQIVWDLMTAAGFSPEEIEAGLPEAKEIFLAGLEKRLRIEEMRLLRGVEALLRRLRRSPDHLLGLQTGNWERGARTKLGRFDLNYYFAFGAFGDGQPSRLGLPAEALLRARETTGHDFGFQDLLLVGDSILDVECALAHGISLLAVASGWVDAATLRAAGATHVFPDMAAAARHPWLNGTTGGKTGGGGGEGETGDTIRFFQ